MPKPVVMTVHGIRTRGEWQKEIGPRLAVHGFIPYSLDFGVVDAISMFFPWKRAEKIQWLREAYDDVREHSQVDRPSVICHSFGSWLVGELLRRYDDVIFDAVILTGSILPASYDWAKPLDEQRVLAVRNEIASRDIWPTVASQVPRLLGGGCFGAAGVTGFEQDHALLDQPRQEIAHSGMFYRSRFTEWSRTLREPRIPPENLSLLEETIALAHDEFCRSIGWDPALARMSLWVPTGEDDLVVPSEIAHVRLSADEILLRIAVGRGAVGTAFEQNRAQVLLAPPILVAGAPDLSVLATAPIRARDEGHLIGVLAVDTSEAGIVPVDEASKGLLKCAVSLAAAVVGDTYQEKTNGC